MKIVIMAGGKGTRLASVASDIPKPMVPIEGKPILEYEIESLRDQGYTDILLVVGHLGHVIRDYFQDGRRFGVQIEYYTEAAPLGTAGALYELKDKLTEDFFLLNADAMMDIDFHRMEAFHRAHDADATILIHPNSHPYDSALIVTDASGQVCRWMHKEEERSYYRNRVNAGVHILSARNVQRLDGPGKRDLDRDILKPLVAQGRVFGYESTEYIKDMGTPERLKAVSRDLVSGKVFARNLKHPQKAVFLDRDGTLNEYVGFVTRPEQIRLIPGVADALKQINDSEYLAIVVTNQPVIARGDCTLEELDTINNALETALGNEGAYIDDLFYCPHHPHRGFEGERIEYKIDCQCRKPKPGLLLRAAEKYNIDLKRSYMVGDSLNDLLAGANAGCKPVFIGGELPEGAPECRAYGSLSAFVADELKR